MVMYIVAQFVLGICPSVRHNNGELRDALHPLRHMSYKHSGGRSERIFVKPGNGSAFLHHASKLLVDVFGQVV